MKTDTYTKAILTIIAICLTINVLKDFEIFPSAYANETSKNNAISNIESTSVMDVRLVDIRTSKEMNVNLKDINTSKEMNVNLKNVSTYNPVPVNLKKIETSDKLQTNISEVGGRWMSHGGPVPVKVQ